MVYRDRQNAIALDLLNFIYYGELNCRLPFGPFQKIRVKFAIEQVSCQGIINGLIGVDIDRVSWRKRFTAIVGISLIWS